MITPEERANRRYREEQMLATKWVFILCGLFFAIWFLWLGKG